MTTHISFITKESIYCLNKMQTTEDFSSKKKIDLSRMSYFSPGCCENKFNVKILPGVLSGKIKELNNEIEDSLYGDNPLLFKN